MDNPILEYVERVLRRRADSWGLLAAYAVLPSGRWTLGQWNHALTLLSGQRIQCAGYREVGGILQKMIKYL